MGGVQPIAVGCTLHHLVVKVVSRLVRDKMASLLGSRHLGIRVRGGAEAAVHAVRRILSKTAADHAVMKLDFQNAFNSIHGDKMLEATQDLASEIFPFVHTPYSSPSYLHLGDMQAHPFC